MKSVFAIIFLINCSALAQEFVPGEVIVKFKTPEAVSSKHVKLSNKPGRRMKLEKSYKKLKINHYKAQDGQSTEQLIADLENDPDVEYVEPNWVVSKGQIMEQAMSLSSAQGYYSNSFGLTDAQIDGAEGWDDIVASSNPVVAVIDTGVMLDHDALSDAIWTNSGEIPSNGIDDDGNGYIDDVYGWNFVNNNNYPQDCDGHGTHVAGIVRGTTQYLFDGPPDTPIVKVMALKFLDCNGLGTTAAAIQAIYYAVNNGAKVLNNSWGGGNYSQALHEAIKYSYDHNRVFVAAAGNYSSNNDGEAMYPASYTVPNVISVAASTDYDTLASFSNYGAGTVHIAAPGSWILSSYWDYAYPSDTNQFALMSGTSMAAPFVAGVAALIANEKPEMNGYQIKEVLLGSADVKAELGGQVQGNRRLNSESAVIAAKATDVNGYKPEYHVYPSAEDRELASAIAGGGCGMVTKLYSDINSGQSGKGGKGGGPNVPGVTFFGLLLIVPVLLLLYLREKKPLSGRERRKWQRYAVNSDVLVTDSGGRVVRAKLKTISEGGAGIGLPREVDLSNPLSIILIDDDGKMSEELTGDVVWQNDSRLMLGVSFRERSTWVLDLLKEWKVQLAPD